MTEAVGKYADEAVERIGRTSDSLIPLLQAIQRRYGYLPEPELRRLCEITDITPAAVAGVSTFYTQFRHKPAGRHTIRVCHGTACHVKGAPRVTDALREHLGLTDDEDTDEKGLFTVEKVACLGCCSLAPVMQVDDVTYGHLSTETVPRALDDFLKLQKRRARQLSRHGRVPRAGEIRITLDSCCIARGTGDVKRAIDQALADLGVNARVKPVSCVGMCHETPMLEIAAPDGSSHTYAGVRPDDVRAILRRHLRPGGVLGRIRDACSTALEHLLTDEAWEPVTRYALDTRAPQAAAFWKHQKQIVTEHSGRNDPLDLDEYRKIGGFEALERCRELTREKVLDELERSGLRGRGGAGFSAAAKWRRVAEADSDVKYVVCNGDEGDPGAFMDRMILESYPYKVIEGIAIAAHVVGAAEAVLYIRAEYPLAIPRVREAIDRCEQTGVLEGLHLRIMDGAGAFVCGEETALLESIMGKRGNPRLRPPYPSQKGLWSRPTLVNNVETFAMVPWILRNGAESFAQLGTEQSKGTKVFALAGKVNRNVLVEVPMGVTLRQVVEEIGGGIAEGKRLKAIQVGGPSGGCVPEWLADTPVDYEALADAGAMMGSGGLVVLDEDDCMVEIARYFLEFTQDQSCGKCTFCRVGTRLMLRMLERICAGEGRRGDLEELERLALWVKNGSLCGLGRTAPNPVLSTLKYFRDEYEAHLAGRCPAGQCPALVTYAINDDCIGCTRCAQNCPADAIVPRPLEKHEIDTEKCIRCGTCREVCPAGAVEVR
ncbi:MAG: NAD(P)H-dependent oxidoreductase subunit E [Phycisphaerae bacterium]